MRTDFSPVAIFTYNRLDHIKLTVESLLENKGADQTEVFFFSDAAKVPDDLDAIISVRQYIRSVKGFKCVTFIDRETNYGLAKSIEDGVTLICHQYGRVIVLEDDLVLSPYFLRYMNDALNRYENDSRVMHISGYVFPIESNGLPETFFYRATTCWGWATWQRAWQHFERDIPKLERSFTPRMREEFNLDGINDFWAYIEKNSKGIINTWAIFWYASVFLHKGLCLHPAVSYVKNIGHDGTGTNCGLNNTFEVTLADQSITEWTDIIIENELAVERLKKYYIRSSAFHRRALSKAYAIFGRIIKKISIS